MSDDPLILVLDEGTSSTRAILYRLDGAVLGSRALPISQHYPAPGLVEHDAEEIWQATLACGRAMVEQAGGAGGIAAIGITNQRETVVAWDRRTGRPLHRAIVWQDRRTADRCAALREAGHEPWVQARTGLLLDPYFSGTKMAWLAARPDVAAAGEWLALGTVDSWLAWKLTGGTHVSDASNASRTMLLDLDGRDWDDALCDLLAVPRASLPAIVGNTEHIGLTDRRWFGQAIPITAMIGDQQSATVGQGCNAPGQTKLTLGTGAFALTSLGSSRPTDPGRLLGTILTDIGGDRRFALEGSIFVAGSLIKWLRDNLGLLGTAGESEALARSVEDSGGVTLLPALAGLGAPYWRPAATAVFAGLTFASTRAHLVRAALEAITHQCVDLADAFARTGAAWDEIRLDGGMSANNWLAEDLAAMLNLPATRPDDVETTARGAAMLAAVGAGLYTSLDEARAMLPPTRRFDPRPDDQARATRLAAWQAVLKMSEGQKHPPAG
ncbi:glycerol kinase GlpK [Sphingomonas ginkgonis]|uniref:Glycerol kinase GlpK n=1 Tax=Sphingomonas ginkgonis TaxID=2315330 RepID=A0A3R9X6F3_9SPHN|nr:glycerol kinase GlpK [Sphingomonas ginkgonis]RST29908.1 glycerol kinase GlpK [Sphingomonas ginkgonis]